MASSEWNFVFEICKRMSQFKPVQDLRMSVAKEQIDLRWKQVERVLEVNARSKIQARLWALKEIPRVFRLFRDYSETIPVFHRE